MLVEKSNVIEYSGHRTQIMVYKDAVKEDLPFDDIGEFPKSNDFGSYSINHINEFRLMPGDIVVSLSGTLEDPQVYKAFILLDTDEEGVYIDESLMENNDGINYHRNAPFAAYFLGQQVRVYRNVVPVKQTKSANIDIDQIEIKS